MCLLLEMCLYLGCESAPAPEPSPTDPLTALAAGAIQVGIIAKALIIKGTIGR